MRSKIGKFEILRTLGNGTMGEVFLGRDPDLDREVAIKTILQGSAFGAESVARFQREAKAMAALNHPHIITLFDSGVDDGTTYLVMEYLEGEDLARLIHGRTVAKASLLEALAQACEGLAYAHGRGVIHRDVKPGNILVARRGDRLLAKLMDFGIAAVDRSELTQTGAWMGTVNYMAPEYLDTGRATPSADIFAAGVIIYEILAAGRKPFAGETPSGTLGAILSQEPAPLSAEDCRGVPGAILAVMAKALDKNPSRRHASADDLAMAIRAALSDPGPEAAGIAPGAPVVVGKGAQATCPSLGEALRQAASGATIRILPGLYPEPILVDREVTVRGDGDSADILFSAGITVGEGVALTLVNATVGNDHGVGLRVLQGARITAEDSWFQDSPACGVELGPGTVGNFLRCQFNGNGFAGLLALEGSRADLENCDLDQNHGAGAHACRATEVRIRASRLNRNEGQGISGVDAASLVLEGCQLARNQGPGVLLHRGGTARLDQCAVTDGESLGIACHKGATLALKDSRIQGNAKGGILLAHDAPAPALGPGNQILDSITKT